MKWLKRIALAVLLVILGLVGYAIATARRSDHPVALQVIQVKTATGPMSVAVFYPTTATPRPTTFVAGTLISVAKDGPVRGDRLPLIVMSHGNGASGLAHSDLAMDLASAGYVVAAPTHPGDNFADMSGESSPALFSRRADQVRSTLDYMTTHWAGGKHLDPSHVGAFGFSAGAFTVLTLIGGHPNMGLIADHCRKSPEFICAALEQVKSPLVTSANGAGVFRADPRIRTAVVVAPGLGFTFSDGGLRDVQVPVQLWSGAKDVTVPFESNTRVVRDGMGGRVETHSLANASHLSFLAPCGLLKPPAVCADPAGFDRAGAHREMNNAVISFFDKQLRDASTGKQ